MMYSVVVGVAPTSVPFRNAVWLVCKHLSHLGMQLKDPVYKKLCTLAKVDYSQHCSSTSHLIVTTSKRQNPLMKLSKKELGD